MLITVTTFSLLAAISGLSNVYATPVSTPEVEELVLITTETLPNNKGVLSWYGESYSTKNRLSTSVLESQAFCGTQDVTCDSENVPDSAVCGGLIDILEFGGNKAVPNSPLSICLTLEGTNGSRCCVTWSLTTADLVQKDLVTAAKKTYNKCLPDGQSGLARNVDLEGVCVVQCLSNRPDPCR